MMPRKFRPADIFGREPERERLRQLLTASIQGAGSTVLIAGESGIGKTTLVEDLIHEAGSRDVEVLAGSCYDMSSAPPYGPWIDAFERSGRPEFTRLLEEQGPAVVSSSQPRLFPQVIRLLLDISAGRALLLVLEDLHWADPASLDLLRYVACHARGKSVMLVLTYRDNERTQRHPLYRLLPVLAREAGAERIDLRPLEGSDVDSIVSKRFVLSSADRRRLARFLHEHAGGNPLFLTEIVRLLQEERLLERRESGWTLGQLSPAPPLVSQVIEHRLSNLTTATRRMLEGAAVIGQVVPLDLWQQSLGSKPDDLHATVGQAVEAHMLTWLPGDTHVHFGHELTREALYAGIPPPRRRALHRQVADALLALSDPDPDVVSSHMQQAGDPRAVELLVRAGLRARACGAWTTAAERFQMAASLLEGETERLRERGWLLFYSAFLQRFSDDAPILKQLDDAERIAVAVGDPLLAGFVLYHRGSSRSMRGDLRAGVDEIGRGIDQLTEIAARTGIRETEDQARSVLQSLVSGLRLNSSSALPLRADRMVHEHGTWINWLALSGRYREALEQGEVFRDQLDTWAEGHPGHSAQAASCFLGLGHAYAALGRPDDAVHHFEMARKDFTLLSDFATLEHATHSELLMVTIPYRTDQLEERARMRSDAAAAWAQATGAVMASVTEQPASELPLSLLEGRWEAARLLAPEMLRSSTVWEFQQAMVALAVLGHVRGEPDQAWEYVHRLLPAGPATEPGGTLFPHGMTAIQTAAELALDTGEGETARAWIEAHDAWLSWSGAHLWRAENRLLKARYHRFLGDIATARACATEALALASEPRQPLCLIGIHRFLGDLDLAVSSLADADAHLRSSLSLAELCQIPYEEALTRLALAELRIATGHLQEASAQLWSARTTFTSLGARPALARADNLEAATVEPGARPLSFPEELHHEETRRSG